MSEKTSVMHKKSRRGLPFHEIRSIITSGDSAKLKEIIKEGRIDDINMTSSNFSPVESLLSFACQSGFIDCAEVLLENGADVNFCDYKNNNPVLESSVLSGSADIIKLLITRGIIYDDFFLLKLFRGRRIAADTDIADILVDLIEDVNYSEEHHLREPSSFLYYSCIAGNLSATQSLIHRGATQLPSALRGACAYGHIEVVKLILYEAKGKADRLMTDEGLKDALVEASRCGHLAIVQLLFEYGDGGSDVLDCGVRSEGKAKLGGWITGDAMKRVLVAASGHGAKKLMTGGRCGDGHMDIMKMLIEHGVDADALNAALWRAVYYDSVEVVELLIDSGADISAVTAGGARGVLGNALTIACKHGYPPIVRLLLVRGADPNQQGVPSPLLNVISRYSHGVEIIQLLLEYGADPNDTRTVTSPLKVALQRLEALQALLEYGANPNILFSDGSTALLEVLEQFHGKRLDAFTLLLQHDADPNFAKAHTGETPLMVAATAIRVEYVKLLLEYGADVTQTNTAGQTVLDMLGRTRKYSEVVDLCTSYVETNRPGEKHVLK